MKVTDASSFGKALRQRQKELNYTQAFLAEFSGFSVSFISDLYWAKRNTNPYWTHPRQWLFWRLLLLCGGMHQTSQHSTDFHQSTCSGEAIHPSPNNNIFWRSASGISIDGITERSFRALAKEVGLGERMAMNRFYSMCSRIKTALHESATELTQAGYPKASEIEERILMTGGAETFH